MGCAVRMTFSVTQTALTGISAAGSMMRVVANNLANSQTPGFKASNLFRTSMAVLETTDELLDELIHLER